jgi:hypothetical protein
MYDEYLGTIFIIKLEYLKQFHLIVETLPQGIAHLLCIDKEICDHVLILHIRRYCALVSNKV